MSQEETGHAELLMKYQNNRGGRVVLQDIKKPDTDDWGNGLAAMTTALKLERDVNTSLLELHKIAETNYDPHLDDFVEEELLGEQVKSIKELADYVAQLTRVGPGLGEYMFDKETLQKL
ncbi:soma ferritin-like isoform X2 [Biomphalaria glabrata]|nr:soma ferritin-like isoform X2 [Biomphalaria glabrata]